MKKNLGYISIIVIVLCLLVLAFLLISSNQFKGIVLKGGRAIKSLSEVSFDDENVYASLETYKPLIKKDLWCIATDSEYVPSFNDNWQEVIDTKCNIKIENNDKYIYIRDSKKIGERYVISDYISTIAKIDVKSNLKLIKDEIKVITTSIRTVGNPNISIKYISEDENIARIEDGKVIAVDDGSTKIQVLDNYGNKEVINVDVTSLITLPKINNSKPSLKYKQYSQEEAKILDEYLAYQISEAGDYTRAGVVAAARFLTLEFKQRIPYFLENGRITHFNHQRPYCDGEGRYYHKGLYLSTDKYADIEKSVAGPTMWGGYIKEWSTDNGIMPNG